MISIPRDKQKHLIVGLIVAVWAIFLVVASAYLALKAASAIILAAGLTSAITGEAHQWLDNRDAKARGETPTRTVSGADALAGSAACIGLAAIIELGYESGIATFIEVLRWLA